MANKPVAPAWCENAIPTANGWEDPDTGELYASGGFTTEEIDLFFGRKSIVYSAPLYNSVCPFCLPKPLTSVIVIPEIPISSRDALTSSTLNGLIIAVTNFMFN